MRLNPTDKPSNQSASGGGPAWKGPRGGGHHGYAGGQPPHRHHQQDDGNGGIGGHVRHGPPHGGHGPPHGGHVPRGGGGGGDRYRHAPYSRPPK